MTFKNLQDTYTLANDVQIPCIGFGTWQTPDGETAINSVKAALKAGYRHIDTAACYGNEASVGQAIKESGVPREEIFVTSKVWNTERGYEKTLAAFETTMAKLDLDYVDLYLIHWPAAANQFENWKEINAQTWRALEELYIEGKVKAIGVSNFLPHHLEALLEGVKVVPMVNQIEYHPGFMQAESVAFCKAHNILVEAWSPLGTGNVLNNETLIMMAQKYSKTVAQICIRWVLQHGLLPLPKSVTESRIIENTEVFDFEIKEEDMAIIDAIPFCGGAGINPDAINF
ncbi:MAG: aldo/keto reductase [Zhenhengia sp.]|jgi:diketogulonate reductase-like aldo/keto reductase|uniref:aldo/keto reductase n=1 Tax=Zhenhengia sp. TaxID=2944208 RepID=UPI0029106FD3|nr:aldo/keto reductase [Clostridiales bacterium]MDU6975294.1 aldo/keto reductase [Clostridiales bacterium]